MIRNVDLSPLGSWVTVWRQARGHCQGRHNTGARDRSGIAHGPNPP